MFDEEMPAEAIAEVKEAWTIFSGDDFDQTSRECEVFLAGWLARVDSRF